MTTITTHFHFDVYNAHHDLPAGDAQLLEQAGMATEQAYAPYSHFRVGAAALLKNGKTVTGSNQENASFPAGICAERVLLSAISSQYPGVAIDTIAISYHNENGPSDQPISPCGICRQSLLEYEERTNQPIRLILAGRQGKAFVIKQAAQLLPLAFTAAAMVDGR